MSEESPLPALPQVGDRFPSLRAFDKATRDAQRSLDPAIELIQGKERANTLSLVCKRGRRKPGRRRPGERKLEDRELCPFTLSATLDDDASPPAYIVQFYMPHHHLNQQICSSSPAQTAIPLPVSSAPPPVPTPNPIPPPRRRRSIATGSLRNAAGRFVSTETTRTKKELSNSLLPFSIPFLPICRQRPPLKEHAPMLADTDEYLVWKKMLGIKTDEVPSEWSEPALKGRELLKHWGWMPEGAQEEPKAPESAEAMDEDDQELETEDHEGQDADYQSTEEQPDPSSDDLYQPQPKRRRKSASRPPHGGYGLVRSPTRSISQRSLRCSSIHASDSPESRRGFWAREDDDDEAEATITPDTPFVELESRKRKRGHSSADQEASMALVELSSCGAEPFGLGLDLGAPAVEENRELDTPAIVGTGFEPRRALELPFPCTCQLSSDRPHLRIDTINSDGAQAVASSQPTTADTPVSQSQKVSSNSGQHKAQVPAPRNAVIAAIELTLPLQAFSLPTAVAIEPTRPSTTPGKNDVFALPSSKKHPDVSQEQSIDNVAIVDSHQPSSGSPAVSKPASASPVPIRAASPATIPFLRADSACSDASSDRPATFLFKPRRAPKVTSQKSSVVANPTLKVALASAENASTLKRQGNQQPETPVLDLLEQREEIKQLNARFYDGSETEVDPLYCSSDLDHKLASLRSLGHVYSSNPAYTTLLASHRPSCSQLRQLFLHVACDGASSTPSPASARPLSPRLLAATNYLWGRDLNRVEMEVLERKEKGLWKLVEEMVVVREVSEKWDEVGREMEKERVREREGDGDREGRNDSPKRRYQHQSLPSGAGDGRKYKRGAGRSAGGRGWRKHAEPPRGGGWKPDPKGDRWAR